MRCFRVVTVEYSTSHLYYFFGIKVNSQFVAIMLAVPLSALIHVYSRGGFLLVSILAMAFQKNKVWLRPQVKR